MLWIVLVLVAAAFGLLVTALTSGDMLWAWFSVAASALAAIVLIVDWSRRRSRARAARLAAFDPDGPDPVSGPDDSGDRPEPAALPDLAGVAASDVADPDPDTEPAGPATEPAVALAPASTPAVAATLQVDPDVEPPEEDTDAADVLVVSESELEVRVVDERPRYHLASCAWLDGRPTLPLPVREARELDFGPCAVCTPDRVLAARTRRRRATSAG